MNIYPHVFEAKTRKFGDAKIFHFTVGEIFGEHELPKTALNTFQNLTQNLDESLEDWADRLLTLGDKAFRGLPETYADEQVVFAFCLFCCFTSQVNSFGHCETVSSPNHTFSWAGLNKRLTSNSCTYFRL